MKASILPLATALTFGLSATPGLVSTAAVAAPTTMHQIYHHHYKRMHSGAHIGHRQACIGRSSGTAHHSCGSHTGGPSGGLH